MRFDIHNSRTTVQASEAAIEWLYDFLAFEDRTHAYKGKISEFRLLSLFDNSFPTGLLSGVLRELRRLRAEEQPSWLTPIEIVDQRGARPAPHPSPDLGWLRDYQRSAVELAVKRKRGIIKIPTGGGKSECFVGLVRSVPCRWLFLAPRMILVRNAAERWLRRELDRLRSANGEQLIMLCGDNMPSEQTIAALHDAARAAYKKLRSTYDCDPGPSKIDDIEDQLTALTATDGTKPLTAEQVSWGHIGIMGDGIDTADLDRSKIIFATFSTMHAKLQGRGGQVARWAQALCVDESHQQPAETFFGVTQACTGAYYRIGMSGTPLARGDRRNVLAIGALGRLLYEIKAKTLIDRGFFAYPNMRFVRHQVADAPLSTVCKTCGGKGTMVDDFTDVEIACPKCEGRGEIRPKYAAIYRAAVVNSKARNALVVQIIRRAAKPSFVFVEREQHGKTLTKLATKAGVSCVFMSGSSHAVDWRRSREIEKLRRGEIEVIITTKILREGVDVPMLASVVKAGAGKSEISVLQELGRGARPDGSEQPHFEYWDVYDEGQKALQRQARARVKALETETEIKVEIVDSVLV